MPRNEISARAPKPNLSYFTTKHTKEFVRFPGVSPFPASPRRERFVSSISRANGTFPRIPPKRTVDRVLGWGMLANLRFCRPWRLHSAERSATGERLATFPPPPIGPKVREYSSIPLMPYGLRVNSAGPFFGATARLCNIISRRSTLTSPNRTFIGRRKKSVA